jgi:hypothetical protein
MASFDKCPRCHGTLTCSALGRVVYCYHCGIIYAVGNFSNPPTPTQNTGRDYGDETRPAPIDYPVCERVREQPHLAAERDAIARRIVREALGG